MMHQAQPHHRLLRAILVTVLIFATLVEPTAASLAYRSPLSFVVKPIKTWRQWRGGGGGETGGASSTSSKSSNAALSSAASPISKSPSINSNINSNIHINYNASSADPGSWPTTDLLKALETNLEHGLTDEQVVARQAQFGLNALQPPEKPRLIDLIIEQFQDRLVQILLVVAVVSALFSVLEHTSDQSLLHSFVEPLVILAILVLNAAVGVWQSQSASDSLDALQQMQPTLCTPLRNNGEWQTNLPASQLVPGDIVKLRVGDKVPADARLLELQSSTFQIDETSLTGESVTVGKLPADEGQSAAGAPLQSQMGMLFSGTMVTSGNALAVVVQTGMDTQFGKIQKGVAAAQEETPKTPLAIKLDEFGETLTVVIGVICLAVWLVSIPKMNDSSFASVWEGALYYAKVSVALGVAAIPEGLPAVITLCLSLGTRRMAQRNVIVRKLPSVETLGCTTVICTDKTGTLTTNEMTVVGLVLLEKEGIVEHTIQGTSYSPVGIIDGIQYDEEVQQNSNGAVADVAAVSALCNDANIVGNDSAYEEQSDDEDVVDKEGNTISTIHHSASSPKKNHKKKTGDVEKIYQRTGEPTEAALCILAEKLGGRAHYTEGAHFSKRGAYSIHAPPSVLASANVDSWRNSHPRKATLEFNRDRKSMSVLADFANGDAKPKNRLLVKGAPNLLLDRCTHVKYRDGTVAKLTGPLKRSLEAKITELATRPLRCIALAVKDAKRLEPSLSTFNGKDLSTNPLLKDSSKYKDIESGLTLVGIVGIKDPARPEVADSIKLCTKAGIRVIMITGDARDTAIAIAKDVNIFDQHTPPQALKAFEGREFFLKSEAEQLEILKTDNVVFCRAEPADKQKLVKMLQSLGEIPAMTGDGVNDAPALQQAAIGIAMGTGTEVSKEAADMILADDNFSSIVGAVEEGRTIYANMQAFICFLISCNIGEICAIFFATLAGFPEPLTAMHLLWVNLVTDGPPATALGFNPPSPDMMENPPRPSDEPIMTRWLLTRYCVTGLYVGLATIGVFAQHYLSQGISLWELSNWSQCGTVWSPSGGAEMCTELFRESGRILPQTLALTTLVCMEMLKALSAVSVDNSIFRVGPQSNKWLLLGVSGPFLLHLLVLYSSKLGLPGLGESFGMVRKTLVGRLCKMPICSNTSSLLCSLSLFQVPLTGGDWTTVLAWAAPIILVDEVLKGIGRYINKQKNEEAKTSLQKL
jgi:Ca2+-transporting ATPase